MAWGSAWPVSLVGIFVFSSLFGFSINTLSLFGLVLQSQEANFPPTPQLSLRPLS